MPETTPTLQTQTYYSEYRTNNAIEKIEGTLVELGTIFTQLSGLVAEQGEILDRVDTNVDNSLDHVNNAQNWLLQYKGRLTGNRGLILKIFLATIAISLCFLVFFR